MRRSINTENSRNVFARLASRWLYVLILVPFFTDWIEHGRFPVIPSEYLTEIVLGFVVAVLVTIIYREMVQLQAMAQTDALTGLYNRRKFMDDLEREVARARRFGTVLSLVYLDVDSFKSINDTYGHSEGDAVLKDVAGLVAADTRHRVDLFYRLGGDEFAVLLLGADANEAATVIERAAQEHKSRHISVRRQEVVLSYGIAQLLPEETPERFLKRADAIMYETKQGKQPRRVVLGRPSTSPAK